MCHGAVDKHRNNACELILTWKYVGLFKLIENVGLAISWTIQQVLKLKINLYALSLCSLTPPATITQEVISGNFWYITKLKQYAQKRCTYRSSFKQSFIGPTKVCPWVFFYHQVSSQSEPLHRKHVRTSAIKTSGLMFSQHDCIKHKQSTLRCMVYARKETLKLCM